MKALASEIPSPQGAFEIDKDETSLGMFISMLRVSGIKLPASHDLRTEEEHESDPTVERPQCRPDSVQSVHE